MVRQVLQKDLCWINPSVGIGRDVAVDDDNLLIGQASVKKGLAVAAERAVASVRRGEIVCLDAGRKRRFPACQWPAVKLQRWSDLALKRETFAIQPVPS